jgi:ArsR family transcriptional regulator
LTPNIDYKKESQVFKALSHPARLFTVETLLEGEKCVLDIHDLLKTSQPNISQHLNILRYADIVDYRQDGNLRCYFLKRPEKMKTLINVLR